MVFLGRDLGEQRSYSEDVARQIDEEVHSIVDVGYKRAKQILTRRKQDMIVLAQHLKEVETIDGDDIDKILRGEIPTGGGLGEIKSLEQKERQVTKEAEKKAKESGRPGFRPEPSPS
jgi:cell division protease FtsH